MNYIKTINYYLGQLRAEMHNRKMAHSARENYVSGKRETPNQQPKIIDNNRKVTEKAEKQQPRNREKRIEQNKNRIRLWHDEQAGISTKLLEMQPLVKQMLEKLMSFSDDITNQYVLQFAKMQIELFDHIYDAHIYHKDKLKFCKEQDYINAVLNYDDFMESIIDNLAVFGIEEIASAPGIYFDGAIHEADSDSFLPKTATITKSVRPGFKYKDIIIQKEKVLISMGGYNHEIRD